MKHPKYKTMQGKHVISKLPLEGICWVTALLLLYFTNPHDHHFTLCPLENIGFAWCPGCGLGRSIALFLHGEISASFAMHGLGIPAFFVIVHRIYSLLKQTYSNWIYTYHHEQP